jgi:O-methyltransferase
LQGDLYLEFGVWKGYSIRCWSRLLKHPQSMLHGFDSFEDLPENWTAFYREGSFSEAGQIPEVSDNR